MAKYGTTVGGSVLIQLRNKGSRLSVGTNLTSLFCFKEIAFVIFRFETGSCHERSLEEKTTPLSPSTERKSEYVHHDETDRNEKTKRKVMQVKIAMTVSTNGLLLKEKTNKPMSGPVTQQYARCIDNCFKHIPAVPSKDPMVPDHFFCNNRMR